MINSYQQATDLYLNYLRAGLGNIRLNKNAFGFNHFGKNLSEAEEGDSRKI